VNDHDHRHDHGQNVHKVVCHGEDERVCDLNCPRIALGLDARAAVDLLLADERA